MPNLNCIEDALTCTGWNRARIRFIARFIVALLTARTVCLARIACLFPSEAASDSSYKRMQRFLRSFDLDFDALACLLVRMVGMPAPWKLAVDRTNWKLGKADLNILMLCVVYNGVGFPLVWRVLEKEGRGKAGNSNTQERIALLERFVALFDKEAVAFLCGDREFVSRDWLTWLLQAGVPFRLRLKGDVLITNGRGELVCADWLFRDCPFEKERSLGFRQVLGQRLFVVGTRLAKGDFLIVVSDRAFDLSEYAFRWGIETMFGAFKSRGFHLEDTHVVCPKRLSRLLGLLSIAYCWAFTAGCWLSRAVPLKAKKHGRMPVSFVRRGLDYLYPIALQLCASVKKGDLGQAIRFLSCT